jgi:hypothetical protein
MTEMVELDTTKEEASPNGHNKWQTYDDDQALLNHIFSKKPAEKLISVPEWEIEVLCRALNSKDRITIQKASYNETTKFTNYRDAFVLIVMAGCYNPTTGHKIFTASHRAMLEENPDGAIVEELAMQILHLSKLLFPTSGQSQTEQTRKN